MWISVALGGEELRGVEMCAEYTRYSLLSFTGFTQVIFDSIQLVDAVLSLFRSYYYYYY